MLLWDVNNPKMTEEFFMDKVMPVTELPGCWIWGGTLESHGYGKTNVRVGGKSKNIKMHRFAYELFVGPIPKGMSVCHRCDIAACVNPHHLFLATHRENMLDRDRKGRCRSGIKNASLTHCKSGHEYTKENTYLRPTGGRACRACSRENMQRYRRDGRCQ